VDHVSHPTRRGRLQECELPEDNLVSFVGRVSKASVRPDTALQHHSRAKPTAAVAKPRTGSTKKAPPQDALCDLVDTDDEKTAVVGKGSKEVALHRRLKKCVLPPFSSARKVSKGSVGPGKKRKKKDADDLVSSVGLVETDDEKIGNDEEEDEGNRAIIPTQRRYPLRAGKTHNYPFDCDDDGNLFDEKGPPNKKPRVSEDYACDQDENDSCKPGSMSDDDDDDEEEEE
jgi:hypothetical protein